MRQESLFPEEKAGAKRGRKKSESSGASHQAREKFDPRHPLHVTLKIGEGLPSLRGELEYAQIKQGFREGCERPGRLVDGEFRLAHYSVQGNHMHLIVEAGNLESLARGIGGLCIRIAKRLNRLWGRKGKVFAERYHVRELKTPTETRNALAYVFHNAVKHGRKAGPGWIDTRTSAQWFDGFEDCRCYVLELPPVAEARTWLLREGWRRAGPLWARPPQPAAR